MLPGGMDLTKVGVLAASLIGTAWILIDIGIKEGIIFFIAASMFASFFISAEHKHEMEIELEKTRREQNKPLFRR